MPAYEDTLAIPKRTWVLLTPDLVPALRTQCQGPYDVHLKVTQSPTIPPTDVKGSIWQRPADGFSEDEPLTALFGGSLGGNTTAYVWAWGSQDTSVSVSYA